MSASDVIKELRKRLGVADKPIGRLRLARMIGLSTNMIIWQYEKGKRFPSHTTWMKIADEARKIGYEITPDMMRESK